ncbi:MAG: hypothetical protein M3481_00070 [Actinomycetota bacterium]|jgi:hypothetical protein|nr:hypothetical protein [Actinomycetota bacterium]
MTVLLDTDVHVHYRFLWLTAADSPRPPEGDPRSGQDNGLCGAAVPGALGMVTGLHTGLVPVRVEALGAAPPLDNTWEDVVEVSFHAPDRSLVLSAFDDAHELLLPQAGELRARWSARGMDAACEADTRLEDEPALDAYLLQLWPAALAPDIVLRQTSAVAAYWHGVARSSAPPPSQEEMASGRPSSRSGLSARNRLGRPKPCSRSGAGRSRRHGCWPWGTAALCSWLRRTARCSTPSPSSTTRRCGGWRPGLAGPPAAGRASKTWTGWHRR